MSKQWGRLTSLLAVLVFAATSQLAVDPVLASSPRVPFSGPQPACARPLLPAPTRAAEVRRSFPTAWADAARRNDRSRPALKRMAQDDSLWLDRCGRAFYVDSFTHQRASATAPPTSAAPPAGTDVFALQSDPGSDRTIYLDFFGDTVTGTAWNATYGSAIVAAPMSLDESVDTNFSAEELEAVYQTWLVVSEDYAPFDVNVTTADPGDAAIDRSSPDDLRYGTRVLVTTGGPIDATCNCGGIAYLNAFEMPSSNWGAPHAYYQPAWVFADSTGSGWAMGQAASHEVGHNFGLRHDGNSTHEYDDGAGAWAPIMGIGYDRALSQWSQGEYHDANNHEDDVAIIARNTPIRRDDHGDTAGTGTPLEVGQSLIGTISTRQDVDAFTFTAAGETSISVRNPSLADTNLDVRLTVLDEDGQLVDAVDPAPPEGEWILDHPVDATFEAVWNATLPDERRTYTALVDGVGAGDPRESGYSDYGSLGRYHIKLAAGVAPSGPLQAVGPGDLTIGAGAQFEVPVFTAVGGVPPYSWSGDLPPGIAIDPLTGIVSGRVDSVDDPWARIRLTDARGSTVERYLGITVEKIYIPETAFQFTAGRRGSEHLAAYFATDPIVWRALSALPEGLSLDADGTLSGTPTTPGEYQVEVEASSAYTSAVTTVSISIASGEHLAVRTTTLRFRHGVSGSERLTATGARGPVTWAAVSGLPSGLSLEPDGTLHGTPSTIGSTAIQVTASTAWSAATGTVAIEVEPQPLGFSTARLPSGRVGRGYSAKIILRNPVGTVRWQVRGSLPPGVTLRPATNGGSATLVGKPIRKGLYRFTLSVTDPTTGLSTSRHYSLRVTLA